jgi:hypothetical protein
VGQVQTTGGQGVQGSWAPASPSHRASPRHGHVTSQSRQLIDTPHVLEHRPRTPASPHGASSSPAQLSGRGRGDQGQHGAGIGGREEGPEERGGAAQSVPKDQFPLRDLEALVPSLSGDTTPCRMTGVTSPHIVTSSIRRYRPARAADSQPPHGVISPDYPLLRVGVLGLWSELSVVVISWEADKV